MNDDKANKLADAVRVFLYGNGNTVNQIKELAECLADIDGCVPPLHYKSREDGGDYNRLLMIECLLFENQRAYFSGDEWNK